MNIVKILFLVKAVLLNISHCANEDISLSALKSCLKSSKTQIVPRTEVIISKYLSYCDKFDLRYHIRPKGYLLPSSEADVQQIILCSKQLNLNITVKCGGHNFEGYAYGSDNHWVVYLKNLDNIDIDQKNGVFTVGAGVINGNLISKLMSRGYTNVVGVCSQVGVSGFTLGGGIGFNSRTYGLGIDHVKEMKLVTPNATLLVVNEKTEKDLFWALLGSGALNYGIVTELRFDLTPIPKKTVAFQKVYTLADFAAIFPIWQKWCEENPDEALTPSMYYNYPKPGELSLHGIIICDQNDCKEQIVDDIVRRFPNITKKNFYTLSHSQSYSALKYKVDERFWKMRSFFVEKSLNDNQTSSMVNAAKNLCNHCFILFDMLRGKISKSSKGAYVHRNAFYTVTVAVGVPSKKYGKEKAKEIGYDSLKSLDKFIMETKDVESGHTYQNYVDNNLTDWRQRYYGHHHDKLQAIKKHYDSCSLFRCPQCLNVTDHYTC